MPFGFKLSHRLSLTKAAVISAAVLVACTTNHLPTALTAPTSSAVAAAGTPSGVPGTGTDFAVVSRSDRSVPVLVGRVSVSPATAGVAAGSTLQLTAAPRDANGNAGH